MPVAATPAPIFDAQTFLKLFDEIKGMREQFAEAVGRIDGAHEKVLARAQELETSFDNVKKGPKGSDGIDGVDAVVPDVETIARAAAKYIPVPKNGNPGKDAQPVNLKKLARAAAKHVVVPTVLPPKETDPEVIVGRILEHFKEGKVKLNVAHLEGLEQTLSPIRNLLARGGIRGGGDTVAAGTNVTITRLANGQVQISASSGAGFTALTATETPNGNITVFTFAAATAQPSYLVVDNVWMKAISKAGTVNWTWNSGTKQATLAIPPNDDIFGIV